MAQGKVWIGGTGDFDDPNDWTSDADGNPAGSPATPPGPGLDAVFLDAGTVSFDGQINGEADINSSMVFDLSGGGYTLTGIGGNQGIQFDVGEIGTTPAMLTVTGANTLKTDELNAADATAISVEGGATFEVDGAATTFLFCPVTVTANATFLFKAGLNFANYNDDSTLLVSGGEVSVSTDAAFSGGTTETVQSGGALTVTGTAIFGSGAASFNGDSQLMADDVIVDADSGALSQASLTLAGEGTSAKIVGLLGVGDFGIAPSEFSKGSLTLTGATMGAMEAGDQGGGYLSVDDGATITATGIGIGDGTSTSQDDELITTAAGALRGYGDIASFITGRTTVGDDDNVPTYSLQIDDSGTIEADGGVLKLEGNLTGEGQVLVGDNSTLELGGKVDDDVTVMFLPGDDETIVIDDPQNFKGAISSQNCTPGDKIDLPYVPYVDPGSADLDPDGASFYLETGEDQPNYVLKVVEDDQTYDIPINQDDDQLSGGFALSDDGRGGTLVTYAASPVTNYSLTATADGQAEQNYAGVVHVFAGVNVGGGKFINSTQGSAFAVGQNLILTAMHVAINDLQKGGFISVELAPHKFAFGFITAHGQNNAEPGANDWAYVYVPRANFSVSQWFPLNKLFPGGNVILAGYPGKVNGKTVNDETQSHQYNFFERIKPYGQGLFEAPIPFEHGISGGVAFTIGAEGARAVGIIDSTRAANGYILSAANIHDPPAPVPFYTDPPSNEARITSAVVIQTGDADTGQAIQIVLNLSENVTLAGAGPTLTLNDGGVATYDANESSGTELIFDYTVGAGDQTNDLEITGANSTDTVQAPGGDSIDFSVLDNKPTNLSINSPLTVDSVAALQSGEAGDGAFVRLELTMSEAVNVDTAGGAPILLLDDNATATFDAAASDPSAGTLVFDYTVGADDATPNLEVTSVDLPTGTTITDVAGYNADFAAADDAPTGLQIGPAYITAITPSDNGELTTGETERLTLAMSQAVTVNTSGGSPTLALSDGAKATYDAAASNPSAGNLVFDYAIGSSDYTTDLQILTYDPNGATVVDPHGVAANFALAADDDLGLDVNAAIVTEVTAMSPTPEPDSGQLVRLTLAMNEPVGVNLTGGSPTLSLDDGAMAVYDTAASDPSTGSLVFDYTVGASDQTPNLQIGDVTLNGATIDDARGHAVDLSAAANFSTNLQIGPAFVGSVTSSLFDDIFTGQTEQITLTMSQAVIVDTTNGSPTLSLSDGATATYDDAASDPATGALVFDYTVGPGDYATDLTVLGYVADGATVTDANGVSANFADVADDDLYTDVNAAIVTDVAASPSTGEADAGATVAVTLTMNEPVTVDTTNGSPTLSLGNGATATYDSAASDPSAGTLVFDYKVGATDETPDLQVIQANLNGAKIDDANGNAADLLAAANFDTGLQIGPVFIDEVTPSLSGDITTGQTVQLSVSMSAPLTVDTAGGSPTLALSDSAVATYDAAASSPADDELVFDYKVASGDYATDLSVTGFNPNGASVTDANGVSPDFSGLAQSDLGLDVNAATVTNVTASPSTGAGGQQAVLTLTMSEPLTINTAAGSPTLYLSDGAIAAYDAAASNPSADTLAFDFTVGRGDYTPDLAITKVNLHGAFIKDGQGNAPDFAAALGANTGLEVKAACYCRGARLATPRGYVAIEDLREGDLVTTASGETRPVRWIGHRGVDVSRHPDPPAVWPVRVLAGAFGDGLPRRDLWLSPGHNVACKGALMPISALINGASIAQERRDRIEYWHVELDAHDVILAEGLPAESYLDCGNRAAFANGSAFTEAHPDFAPKHWAETCLPLVNEGREVDSARAHLRRQFSSLGFAVTTDADPHLLADGGRVAPLWLNARRLAFVPPPGSRAIVLLSRSFVPAYSSLANADLRDLGLSLARLQIDGMDLALDDSRLGLGWHACEREGDRLARRWTNGAATLPGRAKLVVIDLADDGLYWHRPEAGGAVPLALSPSA